MQQLQKDPTFQEKISRRAYELFIKRGGQLGREAEDWFQAETELLQSLAATTNEQPAVVTPQIVTPLADTATSTIPEKPKAKTTSKVAKQELPSPVKTESKKATAPKKAGSKAKTSKKSAETTA